MASFLTQCPGCMTSFRVSDAQMEAADGMVRCGACLSVFSAPANRITIKQPVDPSLLPVLEPEADLQAHLSRAGAIAPRLLHGSDTDLNDDEPDADSPYEERDASDLWMTDARDRDVPLGDLALELLAADRADDEFEESDAEDDAFDDVEDEDDEPASAKTPQFRIVEEYKPASGDDDEPTADDDDEFDADEEYGNGEFETDGDDDGDDPADADSYQQDPRHRHAATPLPLLGRAAKVTTDRRGLREYLATREDKDALEAPDDDDPDDLSEPATLSERPTMQRTLRFVGLLLLNLLLLAVLMLQYVNANLDTLSRSQRLAPLMDRVCRVLECPLPEQSDLASLSSQDLLIRSHPRFAGALEVSFVFRNDSPDTQPFPAIELGFSDAADQVLANRLFQPNDYLPPELQALRAMPAQSTLQIMLELADPGGEAVNYSIGFRSP